MVDFEQIKAAGGTPENLRAKFDVSEGKELSEKIQQFVRLNVARIQEGVDRNMRFARTYWAVDQAFDAPQKQVSQTIVQGLFDRNLSEGQFKTIVEGWGLTNMLTDYYDSKGNPVRGQDGTPVKGLSLPTFFHVFVPLVSAYTKIRWARLFNERNLYPLYKYQPANLTRRNRLKSEIITSRIQRMSQEMGYKSVERQSILNMLLYSTCINFPQESYYRENQNRRVEKQSVDSFGNPVTTQSVEPYVVKEGVRFTAPHPSRVYYDMAHPLTTINTDTGVSYGGYWDVVRYGEIANRPEFWNLDVIQIEPKKSKFANRTQAQAAYELMYPCNAQFPWANNQLFSNDRMQEAFRYTHDEGDKAIHLATHFVKCVPSEWDLFDYDKPVWIRLIIAGESTVIYAEPMAYAPMVAYLYDHDGGRAQSSSLGLELIPFQDQLTNMFSQYILSVRKNLKDVVFFNAAMVEQDLVASLRAANNQGVVDTSYVPYDPKQRSFSQTEGSSPFHSVQFSNIDTAEIANSITVMLSVMERMLGFSAHELGASASHEQSATEVSLSARSVDTRHDFTGTFIDEAQHAKKNLLYQAMMNHGSDRIFAEISAGVGASPEEVALLGFKVDEQSDNPDDKVGVTGPKSALMIDSFSTDREGRNRVTDTKIAAMMIQNFQVMLSQPDIVQAIGIEKIIQLLNYVLQFSGVPKDFRLELSQEQGAGQQGQGIQQDIVTIAEAVKQVGDQSKQATDQVAQQVGDIAQQIQQSVAQLAAEGANRDQVIQQLQDQFSQLSGITVQ